MFEVTEEMLAEAFAEELGRQEKEKQSVSKVSSIAAPIFPVIIIIEMIIFFMVLLPRSISKALVFAAVSLIADVVLFVVYIAVFTMKSMDGVTFRDFFAYAGERSLLKQTQSLDDETKIRLYEERLASCRNGDRRLLLLSTLAELYCIELETEKAERLLPELEKTVPKSDMMKITKLTAMLKCYDAKEDGENFIRLYSSSGDIMKACRKGQFGFKMMIFLNYMSYLYYNAEYAKAAALYEHYFELKKQNMDSIDLFSKYSETGIAADLMTLAKFHCAAGDTEKAAEYYREAEKHFTGSESKNSKAFIEETRKMLEEAGVHLRGDDSV